MFWGPQETCSAKIWSQASGDDEFDRGYATADDDYHWICEGAHHTLTLFGAENVASNPATARTVDPFAVARSTNGEPSGIPVVGSRPSSNRCKSSGATRPAKPSASACRPDHTPGSSPGACAR